MKMWMAMFVVLGLAACQATTPAAPPIRDPQATISSQVDVSADRLVGDWVVRVSWRGAPNLIASDYSIPGTSGFANEIQVQRRNDMLVLSGYEARGLSIDERSIESFNAELVSLGHGRFRPAMGTRFGDADLLVLWMDADSRTVAIGTLEGTFGWIMDRQATGGEDRITAAKEIMEWMGYDLSRAREISV